MLNVIEGRESRRMAKQVVAVSVVAAVVGRAAAVAG